jgi:hypothetical protein
VFLLLSVVLVAACNKEQWKETVQTDVQIRVKNNTVSFGANVLTIDTLIISLESLSLDGQRLQAENIHLTSAVNSTYTLVGNTSQVSSFSVPQGTYETFQLTSKFGGTNPSITIIGEYSQPSGTVKKVFLELAYNEYLLQDMVNSNSISIDKDNPGIITISIDTEIMFDNLNPSYWNAANQSNINGQNGIEISNSNNSDLFNQIIPKVGESVSYKYD